MSIDDFNAYRAMNYLIPYTHDSSVERDSLLITETFNQRRKKQLKTYDLFPYLRPGIPEWLSDETVKKARQIIDNQISVAAITKQKPKLEYIYSKIREEIDIELEKHNSDMLKIKELKALLPD